MRVLAIDPGLTRAHPTGYAMWDGQTVASGVFHLRNEARQCVGHRLARFRRWLEATCEQFRPHRIVYELPTLRNYRSGLAQLGQTSIIHAYCAEARLPEPESCPPSTLKKWATGNGHASKAEMMARAGCSDEHEADARLLLEWFLEKEELHA